MSTKTDKPTGLGYVVWMHADGKIIAVGAWQSEEIAYAYARYSHTRMPTRYFEVRKQEV